MKREPHFSVDIAHEQLRKVVHKRIHRHELCRLHVFLLRWQDACCLEVLAQLLRAALLLPLRRDACGFTINIVRSEHRVEPIIDDAWQLSVFYERHLINVLVVIRAYLQVSVQLAKVRL